MVNLLRTGVLIAALTALFMAVGFVLGGEVGMLIALAAAAGMNMFAFWNSDKMVLSMQGAVAVDPARAPDLYRMVEELARRADIPTPRLYVIETEQPNAFATGRDPQHAAVAVSSGLLNTLDASEVAGVIAHELAHIKNRDTLTMTLTATLAGAISMLAQFGMFFGGNRNSRDNPLGGLGTLLMVFLAPLAAGLVQMAVSRTREYEADRDGALISGEPLALASALKKISGAGRRVINAAAERNPAMAHLYIANPLSGARMDNLFATHPAVENRVAALEQLATEFYRDARGRHLPPGPDFGAAPIGGRRVPQFPNIEDRQRSRGPWG